MFPEMVGKKVYTETEKKIGIISEIKPDEFGSFIAVIETDYSDFPRLEIPVTRLRKSVKEEEERYIIPESAVPLKLKMIIESEEVEELEIPVGGEEIPLAPEVPPIEKFLEKKEEEIPKEARPEEQVVEQPEVVEERAEETEEGVLEEEKEVAEVEAKGEEEKKPGGIMGILYAIINAIKRIFSKG
ncbi:MAG: PRC-barrel domain-containing protein [Candidatus Njordarchaeia archaeon]